jgi:hypothetical protein
MTSRRWMTALLTTLSILSPAAALAEPGRPSVGAFVGLDWRGMALAGHRSHGPGFQAGALLLGGHLKVGVLGFARPGPLNPETFEVPAARGQSYKGSTTLRLRSDGGFVGLMIAPVFDLPGTTAFSVEVPVTLAQAGFGFYLHGEDRKTPDGRKPSAWENELLDGKDSSFGMGLDLGLRLAYKASRWVQPYAGVHYSTVLGYDTYVRSSYAGLSLVLGVQVGTFLPALTAAPAPARPAGAAPRPPAAPAAPRRRRWAPRAASVRQAQHGW